MTASRSLVRRIVDLLINFNLDQNEALTQRVIVNSFVNVSHGNSLCVYHLMNKELKTTDFQ